MMFAEVLLDGTMIHVDCGGAFRLELPENLLKCTGCGKSMVIRPKPSCPAESAPRACSPRPAETVVEEPAERRVRPAVFDPETYPNCVCALCGFERISAIGLCPKCGGWVRVMR